MTWPLIELIDEPGRAVVDGTYRLSEDQAKAILELRLHRLTGLERDKIAAELRDVYAQIAEYLTILVSREKLRTILGDELSKIRDDFADPRRTELVEDSAEVDIEDLIKREEWSSPSATTATSSGCRYPPIGPSAGAARDAPE